MIFIKLKLMEPANNHLQFGPLKGKFLIAEILSCAFYCHETFSLFRRLYSKSRAALFEQSDDYIFRQMVKRECSFMVYQARDCQPLKQFVPIYNYTLYVPWDLISPALDNLEEAYKSRLHNLPFSIESFVVMKESAIYDIAPPINAVFSHTVINTFKGLELHLADSAFSPFQ